MELTEKSPPSGRRRRARFAAAILLLTGAAGLAGFTTYRALRRPDAVATAPILAPVADATEAANRRREFAGTFATGDKPGDRTLTLHADGRVAYAELGTGSTVTGDADSYEVRRRDKKFALVTTRTGTIDFADLDTLTYWGDTYRRR